MSRHSIESGAVEKITIDNEKVRNVIGEDAAIVAYRWDSLENKLVVVTCQDGLKYSLVNFYWSSGVVVGSFEKVGTCLNHFIGYLIQQLTD